jgi:hypothetical protein
MKNILRLLLIISLIPALNANVPLRVMAKNLMEQSETNRERVAALLHAVNRSSNTGSALTPNAKIASQAQAILSELQLEVALATTLADLSTQEAH